MGERWLALMAIIAVAVVATAAVERTHWARRTLCQHRGRWRIGLVLGVVVVTFGASLGCGGTWADALRRGVIFGVIWGVREAFLHRRGAPVRHGD